MYENDKQNGWGCEYENEDRVYEGIYKNCERYSELQIYSKSDGIVRYQEVKNGKILSICQFNNNHKRYGQCYFFENDVVKKEVTFKNGKEIKKKEFRDNEMIEYTENDLMIYKGEYVGSVDKGFERSGRGESMKYVKGVLSEVIRLQNGYVIGNYVLKENEMTEYEGDKLLYEGGYDIKKNGSVIRDGKGRIHTSDGFDVVVYDNGKMRTVQEVNENEKRMTEKNVEGKTVYTGGYGKKGKEYIKRGKDQLFEYTNHSILVYDCVNGKKETKRRECNKDKKQ